VRTEKNQLTELPSKSNALSPLFQIYALSEWVETPNENRADWESARWTG